MSQLLLLLAVAEKPGRTRRRRRSVNRGAAFFENAARVAITFGGIGTIFGNYLQGALRNPSAAPGQFANLLLGFALAEATGLFGLVVALIILFRNPLLEYLLNQTISTATNITV